ncbi:MAG: metallophosphoesterase [Victivallales bacterium]|nr:metallophosphoesterase [Victivallales bacterium]
MKIIAVGDIHLGRNLPVMPEELNEKRNSWIEKSLHNIVDFAKKTDIDAVLFTGDIIEKDNDRFEALPVLSNFMQQLSALKIKIFSIAGNHDITALPRIKKLIPDLKILGEDGEWENSVLKKSPQDTVNIIGLSHSKNKLQADRVFSSFSHKYRKDNMLNIGLLHCDLESTADIYMPVKKDELYYSGVDLWLLGHIHKPDYFKGETKFGYLGSVTGLDVTETGLHGILFLETENNTVKKITRIPVSPVVWKNINLNLPCFDHNDPEKIKDSFIFMLQKKIKSELDTLKDELSYAKIIGTRVFLKGEVSPSLEINPVCTDFNNFYLGKIRNFDIFIDRIIDKTYPDPNIESLSKQNDPVGILSRIYLGLNKNIENDFLEQLEEFIDSKLNTVQRKYVKEKLKTLNINESILKCSKDNIKEFLEQMK